MRRRKAFSAVCRNADLSVERHRNFYSLVGHMIIDLYSTIHRLHWQLNSSRAGDFSSLNDDFRK